MEAWRRIDNGYMISNVGRVMNSQTCRILKDFDRNAQRYKAVKIKGKIIMVHRLVARAFVDNPNNYNIVDHRDGDVFNNNSQNLRWCTMSENSMNRQKSNGLTSSRYKGVSLHGVKWLVHCDGKHVGLYETETEAARAYDQIALLKYGEYARCNTYE